MLEQVGDGAANRIGVDATWSSLVVVLEQVGDDAADPIGVEAAWSGLVGKADRVGADNSAPKSGRFSSVDPSSRGVSSP